MDTRTHPHPAAIPRGALRAVVGLLLLTLLAVAAVRLTGNGPDSASAAPPKAERALRFEDRPDGAVVVLDARTGEPVRRMEPGTNGFLRGTMRGLARERRRAGIGPEAAFILAARADGRLTLDDPTTGRQLDLAAFGPTNAAVFAELLAPPSPNKDNRP